MGPRGFGKTLKCIQDFTRKSVQHSLNPSSISAETRLRHLTTRLWLKFRFLLDCKIVTLSLGSSHFTNYIANSQSVVHAKHKLLELNKIIEERIGSLREEVEIATNVKLNPLYLLDLKDEIVSLRWTTRIIRWILDRAIDGQQQLGITKKRLELEDTKKFENMLDEKIQELEIEDSNTDREEEVLVKEIGTLKCVLSHLFNLKSGRWI